MSRPWSFRSVLIALVASLGVMSIIASSIDVDDGASEPPPPFSRLLDDSARRGRLPVLPELRVLTPPADFGEVLFFGDVLGNRIVGVGETKMFAVDPTTGAAAQTVDFSGAVGRVSSVTTVSNSDLWIHGSGGFVHWDPAHTGSARRIVILDDEARKPEWFGDDLIVATGSAEVLRFYDVGEFANQTSGAMLMKESGEPLFPIADRGLSVFFNLLSFTVDPGQQRLAVAFQLSDRIHVYGRDGALLRAIAGPVAVRLDFDILRRPPTVGGYTLGLNDETRFTYLDVDSDRDFIIALFGGRNGSEPGMPRGPGFGFSGDELHVVRWDGRPVGMWRLPEAAIRMRLDEIGRRLYVVREFPSWAIVELDAEPIYEALMNEE